MTLFAASVSIVCAAALGLGVGFVAGLRFGSWLLRRTFETMMESESARTPMALAWAYTQVQKRLDEGATVEQVRAFIEQERERIEEVAGQIGAAELGPKLVDEMEERRSRESGEP